MPLNETDALIRALPMGAIVEDQNMYIFGVLVMVVIIVALLLFCAAELFLYCVREDQRTRKVKEDQTCISVTGTTISSVQHVSHIQGTPPVPPKRLNPDTSTRSTRPPHAERDEATCQPSCPTEELSVKQVTMVKRGPPVPMKPTLKPHFAPSGYPTHNTRLANQCMDLSLTINFDEKNNQEVPAVHNDIRLTSHFLPYPCNITFNIDNMPEPKGSHKASYIEPDEILPLDLALFKAELRCDQENEFRKAKERQADAIRRERQRELGMKQKKRKFLS